MVQTYVEAVQGLKRTLDRYLADTNICTMKACNLKEVVVWAWKSDNGQICTLMSTTDVTAGLLTDIASHITAGTPESEIDLADLIVARLRQAKSNGLVLRDGFIRNGLVLRDGFIRDGFEAQEIFAAILSCEISYLLKAKLSDG